MTDTARVTFGGGDFSGSQSAWGFWTRDSFLRVEDLAGKTVNIGTKGGVVYDTATVTGVAGPDVFLEGGRVGMPLREEEPRPLAERVKLPVWEVARGFIHPSTETGA